jgi:hypothetical protein
VFLLADTQIVHEGFLEDVNNILNAGAGSAAPFIHCKLTPAMLPGLDLYAEPSSCKPLPPQAMCPT